MESRRPSNVDDKLEQLIITVNVLSTNMQHMQADLADIKQTLKEDKADMKEQIKEIKMSVDEAHAKIAARDRAWLTAIVGAILALGVGILNKWIGGS